MNRSIDEELEFQIKKEIVSKFENPKILMNEEDFNTLVQKFKSEAVGILESNRPTYSGIPIETRKIIEKGTFYIYDQKINVEL